MSTEVSLGIGRVLIVAAIGIGLLSWRDTFMHVGDPALLMPSYSAAPTHGWYHFFREAGGIIAKVAAFLLIFFGPPAWRTRATWWIALILALGYYVPFWIGQPFHPALAAPNQTAFLIHLCMSVFGFAAIFLARPSFKGGEGNRRVVDSAPSTSRN